jgi:hypothetical protein
MLGSWTRRQPASALPPGARGDWRVIGWLSLVALAVSIVAALALWRWQLPAIAAVAVPEEKGGCRSHD